MYKLSDKITFGKYSTKELPVALTIQEIIERDPEYLVWCFDNVNGFELDKEAKMVLDEATFRWDDNDNGPLYNGSWKDERY